MRLQINLVLELTLQLLACRRRSGSLLKQTIICGVSLGSRFRVSNGQIDKMPLSPVSAGPN
ncbi:hypothetical protein ABWW58_08295 [Sporolactobacillus sp. STCC-11]|uniref:hypothetical protein n=1 Tax=Sporolactobacillus caesalpiniae TaxID=3230362 RepID=UPI003391912A